MVRPQQWKISGAPMAVFHFAVDIAQEPGIGVGPDQVGGNMRAIAERIRAGLDLCAAEDDAISLRPCRMASTWGGSLMVSFQEGSQAEAVIGHAPGAIDLAHDADAIADLGLQ